MFVLLWLICVAFTIIVYIFIRLTCGISKSPVCLIGKTALITGANSGIGYQTALNLASRGCRIIMADVQDMTKSKENIINFTTNPKVITKHLNLASLESVRDFAKDIHKNEQKIDILILNAGIGRETEPRTVDGLPTLMQINYLGHFLLVHLLLDLLKKAAPSRIVFTSSIVAHFNWLTPENLNSTYNGDVGSMIYYSNSKMAMLIASDILAEKLKGTGVTSNAIHPGYVETPFYNFKAKLIWTMIIKWGRMIYTKDAWEGSQSTVHVAISNRFKNITGSYVFDCRPFLKPRSAYNKEFCQSVWKASEKLVGLTDDEKI